MSRLLARKKRVVVVIKEIVMILQMIMAVCAVMCTYVSTYYERRIRSPKLFMRIYQQLGHLYDLVYESDAKCGA